MSRDRKAMGSGGGAATDVSDGPTSLLARGRAARAAQRLKSRNEADEKKDGAKETEAQEDKEQGDAYSVLQDITNVASGMAPYSVLPPEHVQTLSMFLEAKALDDGKHGREVWNLLDALMPRMEPLFAVAKRYPHNYNLNLLAQGFEEDFAHMREQSQASRAKERVEHSMEVDGKVIEDVDMPKGERIALAAKLPSIRESLFNIVGQASGAKLMGDPLSLDKLTTGLHTLTLVGDTLSLDDEELWAKIEHGDFAGAFDGISSVSDLVSKVMKTTQDLLAVGLKAGGAIALKLGKTNLAANCTLLSESVMNGLGPIIEGVDFIHNIVGLFSPDSSVQERVDGGVGAASTVGKIATEKIVTGAATDEAALEAATSSGDSVAVEAIEGTAEQTGKAVAGAAFGSIAINYEMIKILGASYLNTRMEIASSILEAYPNMVEFANNIGQELERLAKAKELAEKETDPAQKQLFAAEAETAMIDLGEDIDSFLNIACYPDQSIDKLKYPGSIHILQRQFAALAPMLARPKPEMNVNAAEMILSQVRYCIDHTRDFLKEDASRPADDPVAAIEMPKF